MAGEHGTVTQGPGKVSGRFDRIFKGSTPGNFGATDAEIDLNMKILGAAMTSSLDDPKDGPDNEESGIPSLFTYFGQFVDHDLTFGEEGQFKTTVESVSGGLGQDGRTPIFDLDNVYGRGPGDQPYLYDQFGTGTGAPPMLLGSAIRGGTDKDARDLPRNSQGWALIGDKRDDENAIVSQLQGLFLQFHNKFAHAHKSLTFDEVRQQVTWHYQWVVLNDYLPKIVSDSVLATLKDATGGWDPGKLLLMTTDDPFMPIEFSVAAYRLGHSMIRPGYRLNDSVLLPIFPVRSDQTLGVIPLPDGLTGFRPIVVNWALDWGRFIDLEVRPYGEDPTDDTVKGRSAEINDPNNKSTQSTRLVNFNRLQFAYKIDTALVDPLRSLPQVVAGNKPFSLAERNLLRGVQFGLPSGQTVAGLINAKLPAADQFAPINANSIKIGKATGSTDDEKSLKKAFHAVGHALSLGHDTIAAALAVFNNETPLWTYILAEATQNAVAMPIPVATSPTGVVPAPATVLTPQLGPVGGRIVAETFLALMAADATSYLNAKTPFTPMSVAGAPSFGLREFVKFATE